MNPYGPRNDSHLRSLLKAVQGDRLEALYVLAITTGMRQGELLGLRWRDVDVERGRLHYFGWYCVGLGLVVIGLNWPQ